MPVKVDKDVCLGCGACTSVCRTGAIALNEDGLANCDEAVCIDCGACADACPVGAAVAE